MQKGKYMIERYTDEERSKIMKKIAMARWSKTTALERHQIGLKLAEARRNKRNG